MHNNVDIYKKTISIAMFVFLFIFIFPIISNAQINAVVEVPETELEVPVDIDGTPFGGLITSKTDCDCSGNEFITVTDYYSNSSLNILVWPPLSRLYQYDSFNTGGYALGTYSSGGICYIYIGDECELYTVDGYINSGPGAGSSGVWGLEGFDLTSLTGGTADILSSAADSVREGAVNTFGVLGRSVGNAFINAGISVAASEVAQLVRPGNEISYDERRHIAQEIRVRSSADNYYVANEPEFDTGREAPILDRNGNVIALADEQFVSGGERGSLLFEKAGVLDDGTVVVYDITIGGIPRYYVLTGGLGVGAEGALLQPFRSIAVNPDFIPLGTLVRIPRTEDMALPDNEFHNGIWRADDVMDNLEEYEISLFIGSKANRVFLKAKGISNQEDLSILILPPGSQGFE
ncbi:hypothetical protein N9L18_00165 [Candidatus Pacebacteria bacterium]|nr:hypothetical protein [Candidatus Paceibacterota bacterium]